MGVAGNMEEFGGVFVLAKALIKMDLHMRIPGSHWQSAMLLRFKQLGFSDVHMTLGTQNRFECLFWESG